MKKERKIKEVALKGVSKSLDRVVSKEVAEWPPKCALFAHQPKRPDSKR